MNVAYQCVGQLGIMADNHMDPESVGAGPINPSSVADPRMKKDKHKFLWSRVHLSHDSIVPPPRSGAASVVVQGKLYVFGGYGVCEIMGLSLDLWITQDC